MRNGSYLVVSLLFVALIILFGLCSTSSCLSFPVPASKPAPETCSFGPCEMPPSEHQGFLLVACKVDGPTSIACLYIGVSDGKKCGIVVATTDCVNYEIVGAQCEGDQPKGETIRWL